MKKGFTIVEVSILFVVFLIVAFVVAPLSLDDTRQAQNTSKWRSVQEDFYNIFYAIETLQKESNTNYKDAIEQILVNETKGKIDNYKISYFNGSNPKTEHVFNDFKLTYANSVVALKFFDSAREDVLGMIMYDVNGSKTPNIWGKDVFGFNIYKDNISPLGKGEPLSVQKQDCSRAGTGLFCSNYYLIGGNFD